jgi:hypothetical protein
VLAIASGCLLLVIGYRDWVIGLLIGYRAIDHAIGRLIGIGLLIGYWVIGQCPSNNPIANSR